MRSAPPASRHAMLPPPAPTVCTSTIGNASARPPTSRPPVELTWPSRATDTSHDVPPMSRHTAPSAPAASAISAAPTAPPAGPLSTVQEPWRGAGDAGAAAPPPRAAQHGPGAVAGRGRRVGHAAAAEHDLGRWEARFLRAFGEPLEVRA